mmetsp:Transcript_16447/g.27909  ORF Transcript_16447/g.27909 Transcript_16447/m.27909 type:complete len:131 (+) Transcript_16447:237-629(+)
MIDGNMMTLPLVFSGLTYLIFLIWGERARVKGAEGGNAHYIIFENLILRPLLSFSVFFLQYKVDNLLMLGLFGFDPSGHILCALFSYSTWLHLLQVQHTMVFSKVEMRRDKRIGDWATLCSVLAVALFAY